MDYSLFNGLPNILFPIINDSSKANAFLHWLKLEAETRINSMKMEDSLDKIPHIFCVIDDFSDISKYEDAKETIYTILRLGRIVKIHFIISTGLPIVQVIPSELKILIPCRIAFSTVSKNASRIIIDENGAELLSSPGEMIFKYANNMLTCQCVHLSEPDMQNIINLLICNTNRIFSQDSTTDHSSNKSLYKKENSIVPENDPLFEEALRIFTDTGHISIGLLQRKLRIGFNRAAQLVDAIKIQNNL